MDDYKTTAEEIFSVKYVTRLYKMFDAILYLLKPNGRMPQIGDNDNGQFLKLYPREVLDMRYLLALGAVFFKESKWKIKEFFESDENIAEVMILYGKKGLEIWNSLEWNSLKNINSRAFSDSGWYVMRNNKDYCIISCGPNGQNGRGGHCHNDKLSFELCIDGEDIIVDPGTYVYTPLANWRNNFKITIYHNTVIIDNKEQNIYCFGKDNLFQLNDYTKSRCLNWQENEEEINFEGDHRGYKRLKIPIIHRRKIYFNKIYKIWGIKDFIICQGKHKAQWNCYMTKNKELVQIKSNGLLWKRIPGFYSSEYGKISMCNRFVAEIEFVSTITRGFYIKNNKE